MLMALKCLQERLDLLVGLLRSVEPIFAQKRCDIVFDHTSIPRLSVLSAPVGAKIAMSHTKAWAELLLVGGDVTIEVCQTSDDLSNDIFVDAFFSQKSLEFLVEFGLKIDKRKSATQRIINQRQRAIGGVHHADQMHVLRDRKFRLTRPGILKIDAPFSATLIRLNRHHQFTKNLRQVAPIDLVDNENIWGVRVGLASALAELKKDAVGPMKPRALFTGAIP